MKPLWAVVLKTRASLRTCHIFSMAVSSSLGSCFHTVSSLWVPQHTATGFTSSIKIVMYIIYIIHIILPVILQNHANNHKLSGDTKLLGVKTSEFLNLKCFHRGCDWQLEFESHTASLCGCEPRNCACSRAICRRISSSCGNGGREGEV